MDPPGIASISRLSRGNLTIDAWKAHYPFSSHFLQLDGLRYHYLDEGTGSPLLMIHGNPTWSFYYRELVRAFRDRYRAVVPDHIGCGWSDKPQDYPYTLEQHIDNLQFLLRRLDLRDVTLLVHDWGGTIGLGAALREPERFSRLILFNTGAFPPPFFPWRIRVCRTPVLGEWAVRGLNLFAGAALSMAVERPLPAPVQAGLLAPYDSWQNRVAIYRFVADIPASPRHPTWDLLRRIEQGLPALASLPTLMIWGMRDWCFQPRCLDRLLQSLPNAEVHRLEDAGHYVIEDASQRIIQLVAAFLKKSH